MKRKTISRRTLIATRQAVVIPEQPEVYRGFQIHYDEWRDLYSVEKPNGRTESDAHIEVIRATIDLIHLTDAMKPKCDIDMAAITQMTESTP